MRHNSIVSFSVVAALALGAWASAVKADVVYGFDAITCNSATNVAIGESQLSLTVKDPVSSGGKIYVDFLFRNTGSSACTITDVYFDDGCTASLGSLYSLSDSGSGVSFSSGASPTNLPSGSKINFVADFSADADCSTQYGVDPGEWLKATFKLAKNVSYASLLSDLCSGDLRIGIYVQGFRYGCNGESFVNKGCTPAPTPVPTPAAFGGGALLLATLGVGYLRRGRNA